MSESDGEQAARSVALEQAYVHEVYEQCAEKASQGRHWPRIYQFLEELEPGALVCDVGCGNGKYLSVNQNIFKVGVDRCTRFTNIAREKENEVLICDNLSLPFRDESFDAVLSIAVVHHFATTERRVRALKELARVLRIGGRLVISVWAMEQRHRKFESQDVLVPWPKAYCGSSFPESTKHRGGMPNPDRRRDQAGVKYLSTSKGNNRKCKNRSYWIDPIFSPSPSTSSLSSPNETCYSFFRRALQKLAGGRRGSGMRPWFLESWQNERNRHYDQEDSGDVDELPIELRRLEDANVTISKQNSLNVKSKSVGDILEIQHFDLVRSRSSIPGLCSTITSEISLEEQTKPPSLSGSKPRLVKQKSHVEDISSEYFENTATEEVSKDLPTVQSAAQERSKRGSVPKQVSMNEELMSTERLEEKERVRRNIMKQASLNEDIICKRTFETLKDSSYYGNATKRFQMLKSGLTNKIKQSTTNIEKVSGISIKNGFVKILQSWKSSETEAAVDASGLANDGAKNGEKTQTANVTRQNESIERRLSREDGSDSSKDSSLQSDTSVDSEDSIASVIFVPKQEVNTLIESMTTQSGCQLSTTSAPPSPRIKHPPDLPGSRLKLMTVSPLLKQFPATSKSLPPPSPPGLSPRTNNFASTRPFFGTNFTTTTTSIPATTTVTTTTLTDRATTETVPATTTISTTIVTSTTRSTSTITYTSTTSTGHSAISNKVTTTKATTPVMSYTSAFNKKNISSSHFLKKNSILDERSMISFDRKRPNLKTVRGYRSMMETVDSNDVFTTKDTTRLITEIERVPDLPFDKPGNENWASELSAEEESRKVRLNQIKELLKQKPGFATRTKPVFPIVRRASTASAGRLEPITRVMPRLMSLELFNPETDDLDSDSSGVSSPESVGSVISVISDERYTLKKENAKLENTESDTAESSDKGDSSEKSAQSSNPTDVSELASDSNDSTSPKISEDERVDSTKKKFDIKTSPQSLRLLEAAANVANSLEDAVGKVIRLKKSAQSTTETAQATPQRAKSLDADKTNDSTAEKSSIKRQNTLSEDYLPVETTWSEECKQHLIDFTEKLSENLIHDIDQYCQQREFDYNDDLKDLRDDRIISNKTSGIPKGRYIFEPAPNYHTPAIVKDSCKYHNLSDTIAWLNKSNGAYDNSGLDLGMQNESSDSLIQSSISEDIIDYVSDGADFISVGEPNTKEKPASNKLGLRPGNSIESSDIGDSIENTISLSDGSQTGSLATTGRLCSGSTVSLLSNAADYVTNLAEKRKIQTQRRSASEEIHSNVPESKQNAECLVATAPSNDTLTISESSSQESLPSDRGGGAITYHQYYHVFREGELDQLINTYVENLHIISSYYDHASWCIVAEKVQVWTI